MGGKITKVKLSRRNREEVDTHRQDGIGDDEDGDEHIYENGSMFPDIDPIDGTYYQLPDLENAEVCDTESRSSIDYETVSSWDSAFSDVKSTTSARPPLPQRFKDQNYSTDDDYWSHERLVDAQHFSRNSQSRRHIRRSKRRSGNQFSRESSGSSYETKKGSSNEFQRCITSGPTDGYTYRSTYGSTYGSTYRSSGWRSIREAPMDRVVFLLDAFEPLIAGSVDVMQIVPHLEFIEDTETFREKSRANPREAVRLLIQRLKESEEPGKWQAFLEALKAEGYVYIANLLLEQTESDHSTNRRILRLFTPELINRIDPEQFIDRLLAEEVIGDADREEIQCEKNNRGNIAASLMLLERVPRRLENWFDIFLGVLEKCGLADLIEKFRMPVVTVENRKIQDGDPYASGGYLTPLYDKPQHNGSSPKSSDCANHHPSEEDQSITDLRKEKEVLSKKLEKKRERYKLQQDIDKIKKELNSFEEGLYDFNRDEEKEGSHQQATNSGNDPDSMESSGNDPNSADNSIPRTGDGSSPTSIIVSQLHKISINVESISEQLREVLKPKNDTGEAGYISQSLTPFPHRFNARPANYGTYSYQSLDSAISMGYMTHRGVTRGYVPALKPLEALENDNFEEYV